MTANPTEAIRVDVLAAAGPTLDVTDAAIVLGITRAHAYQLINRNAWPTRVLRLGRKIVIPTAELRSILGLPVEPQAVAS